MGKMPYIISLREFEIDVDGRVDLTLSLQQREHQRESTI
jgi:hypothetical protein